MFERRHEPLIPRPRFYGRLLGAFAVAAAIVVVSLAIGTVGYHVSEGMGWIDAVYSASMILAGMGPTGELKTDAGKLFASGYALFSGLVFLSAGVLVLTPILHRLLHKFHLEDAPPREGESGVGAGPPPGARRTRE